MCPLKKQGRQQSDKRHESVSQGTDERCENHREDWKRAQDQPHNTPTLTINVSTVQVTTRPVIVQQNTSTRLHLLTILLVVQVQITNIHLNFNNHLPNSTHNKAHQLLDHPHLC